MILTVEDGVIEVSDAPPMRDVVAKLCAQTLGRLAGVGVAPGTKRCQQLPGGVESEIAMHHGRHAKDAH
jgi:hypothetical protein